MQPCGTWEAQFHVELPRLWLAPRYHHTIFWIPTFTPIERSLSTSTRQGLPNQPPCYACTIPITASIMPSTNSMPPLRAPHDDQANSTHLFRWYTLPIHSHHGRAELWDLHEDKTLGKTWISASKDSLLGWTKRGRRLTSLSVFVLLRGHHLQQWNQKGDT